MCDLEETSAAENVSICSHLISVLSENLNIVQRENENILIKVKKMCFQFQRNAV